MRKSWFTFHVCFIPKIDKPVEKEKIMELLELEMRARAIKSLLTRTKGGSPSPEPEPKKEEPKK